MDYLSIIGENGEVWKLQKLGGGIQELKTIA